MGVKRGIVAVEEDPGMLNKKMKNTNVTMGKESVDTTSQESVKNYVVGNCLELPWVGESVVVRSLLEL
jgi:hypothetical protein